MRLRPYQQDAVDAATAWMRQCVMPGLLELATGAGKSHVCAAIAHWVYDNSGKKVLCLQPSKELTEQNYEKYLATGNRASIFSASVGSKCTRHSVVYGTPGTVKNALSRFGDAFGAVIVDEAHETTPTIRLIIETMRKANPNLRVIGMTATPYTMNGGYIYQYAKDGAYVPPERARDPYYNTLLYRIQTRELIDMGFLTPAHADPELSAQYNTGGLQVNSRGQFDSREFERVFEGRGRLTAQIIEDVVRHSYDRTGVMLFAATVEHAKECMESLPRDNSMMLGGDVNMGKEDRRKLIEGFKARRFKYLVSVGTLTKGFDCTHVDLIAVLRATESPNLFQQIIGRGLRLHDEKSECLVLDYAENVERHILQNDLFSPEIRAKGAPSEGGTINACCPSCSFVNEFSARPNLDGFNVSKDGYFLDLSDNPIESPYGPMPAHYGRRCTGQVQSIIQRGVYERCDYRWTCKECPECAAPNDIAARFCEVCKHELIDPNEKLQQDFQRVKADPYKVSTDKVLKWSAHKSVSAAGNDTLVCEYKTEYRTFKIWYMADSKHPKAQYAWNSLNDAVFSGHIAPDVDTFLEHMHKGRDPQTITCHRERGGKFYRVIAHNRPEDALQNEVEHTD